MSRKTEAANMFEDEEDFDAAYRGDTSSMDNDEIGDDEEEIVVAEVADDEADSEADAWAAAEEEEAEEPSDFSDDEDTEDLLVGESAVAEEPETEDAEAVADASENDGESDDDDEAEVSAAREIINRRNNSMAKKSEGKKTKAEMIREEITRRQKAKESMRACDIIASLADEGVEVNASQVSVTLRSMGVPAGGTRGRPAGQKKEKAAAGTAASGTRGRPAKAASEEMSRKANRAVTEKPAQPKQKQAATNGDSFTEADLEATAAFVGAVGNADRGMTLLRIFSRLN